MDADLDLRLGFCLQLRDLECGLQLRDLNLAWLRDLASDECRRLDLTHLLYGCIAPLREALLGTLAAAPTIESAMSSAVWTTRTLSISPLLAVSTPAL